MHGSRRQKADSRKQTRERLMLCTIAMSDPINGYEVVQRLHKVATETMLRADLKRFEREGLVTVRKRKAKRGPNPAMDYTLTRAGLLQLIRLSRGRQFILTRRETKIGPVKMPSSFTITSLIDDVIAERHKDLLPEILRIWPGLVNAGVEQTAIAGLEIYVNGVFEEEVRQRMGLGRRVDRLTQLLDEFFLRPLEDGGPGAERWRQALLHDPPLNEAAKEAVHRRIAESERLRKSLNL